MKMYLFLSSQAVLRIYMLPPQAASVESEFTQETCHHFKDTINHHFDYIPSAWQQSNWLNSRAPHNPSTLIPTPPCCSHSLEALKTVHVQHFSCRGVSHQHSDSLLTQQPVPSQHLCKCLGPLGLTVSSEPQFQSHQVTRNPVQTEAQMLILFMKCPLLFKAQFP